MLIDQITYVRQTNSQKYVAQQGLRAERDSEDMGSNAEESQKPTSSIKLKPRPQKGKIQPANTGM